jgi:hypothetical protein
MGSLLRVRKRKHPQIQDCGLNVRCGIGRQADKLRRITWLPVASLMLAMRTMAMNQLTPLRIGNERALTFLHESVRGVATPARKEAAELFGIGLKNLPEAEKAFNSALQRGDRVALLAATDDLVWAVMILGNFFPPMQYEMAARTAAARARQDQIKKPELRRSIMRSVVASHRVKLRKSDACAKLLRDYCRDEWKGAGVSVHPRTGEYNEPSISTIKPAFTG